MRKRVLLVAAKTGYQIREFYGAAERLGFELVLATDRCHILDDPWADRAVPVQFAAPGAALETIQERGPFDGILAVGDQPAYVAAEIASKLNLRFHRPDAVRAASSKFLTRERFRAAGLLVPEYSLDAAYEPRYPCVVKPLHLSASRGVIRANNRDEYKEASARVREIAGEEQILVEDFIPGREFALEGLVANGQLQILALFDKPDPLDGPYFEETIYVTPSRENREVQAQIAATAQRAITALGLSNGPVHTEMRTNERGVWMLEAAARPIGGLCARVLRFGASGISLEEILLRNAIGADMPQLAVAPGAHGVMMIPIPQAGVFLAADGLEQARNVPGIESLEITAKEGQKLEPLPEGASYLGFIFARGASPEEAEQALRSAHDCLQFRIAGALPVLK
jgi:biotin carboxylase